MDILTSKTILMMYLSNQFLWTKQTAILDNLSNVETPNYKTKYVTFEETLRSRLQSAVPAGGKMREAIEGARPVIHVAENETARMDGNGVDATEQGIELARNALQLQHVMSAVSDDLALLRTAIRGQ